MFCRIFRATFFDLLTGSKSRLRFSAHSVPVGVHYRQARIVNQVNRSDYSCRFAFIRGQHHRPRINQHRKRVETQSSQSPQRNGSNNACESAIVSGINLVNELGQRLRIRSGDKLTISKVPNKQPGNHRCQHVVRAPFVRAISQRQNIGDDRADESS